ncbi:hypothetical protein [Anaplasma capra]|uniref:hypothetical protein n=1 Tax=Anaplasma capra TaxID=1562740 RepID=UPI0021D5A468|nr:hypothetical protein [Anaplasma capra]MCU7611646.1 hypothetical protein [Anaplasma capra]MCU7612206.1 hypothetical protein [Anaplasma capra]
MYEDYDEEVMASCASESGPRVIVANVAFILALLCVSGIIVSVTLPSATVPSDISKWCITAFSAAAALCITIACSIMLIDIVISGGYCSGHTIRNESASMESDSVPQQSSGSSSVPRLQHTTTLLDQPNVTSATSPVTMVQCQMREESARKVMVVAAEPEPAADERQLAVHPSYDQALDDGGYILTTKPRGADPRPTGQRIG